MPNTPYKIPGNPQFLGGRGYKGFHPELRQAFLSNLASNAYAGGMGESNSIQSGLRSRGLGRSAAFLTAPGAGARTQGEIFQRGALPFALAEGQFAEGQFQSDREAQARDEQRRQQWRQFLLQLEEQRRQFDKSQGTFGLQTPLGGISF